MTIKSIYLSGPMTGKPDFNRPYFNEIARKLRQAGFMVYNPGEVGPEDWTWSDYMKRDIQWLLEADAIMMLPGHEESKGARLERTIAIELQIHFIDMTLFLAHLDKLDSIMPA